MPAVFEHSHVVQPHEIDGQDHVNNIEYLRWMQSAAVAHSSAQGWTPDRYLDIGAVFVVRSHHIDYLQPAFINDEIQVITWVSHFGKLTTRRKYVIIRTSDQTVLARAETNWAFIAWPQRTPRRCPPDLVNAFVIVPIDQEPFASRR